MEKSDVHAHVQFFFESLLPRTHTHTHTHTCTHTHTQKQNRSLAMKVSSNNRITNRPPNKEKLLL